MTSTATAPKMTNRKMRSITVKCHRLRSRSEDPRCFSNNLSASIRAR
jgi:hypothetical protein